MSISKLFEKKIRIKKSYFSRNRSREYELGHSIINRASSDLVNFGKLMVAVFLTMPVLSISTMFFESFILITANLIVAVGHCGHFLYRLFHRQVSPIEIVFTLGGLVLSMGLVFYFMPVVFAATMSVSSFLVALNTVATVLNIYFVVNKILFPPLIKLTEHLFAKFGVNVHNEGIRFLDKDQDRNAVERLLKGKVTEENKGQLDTYNRLLRKLCWYKEKYRNEFFGTFIHQEEIDDLNNHLKKLTIDGKASDAIDFIEKKVSFKTTRARKLEEACQALVDAKDKKDIGEYNKRGLAFFENFTPIKVEKELEVSYTQTHAVLFREQKRQAERIAGLKECLPVCAT